MRHISDAYYESALPLEVDYTKNMDEVFRAATSCVTELSRWRDIRSFLQPGRHVQITPARPS